MFLLLDFYLFNLTIDENGRPEAEDPDLLLSFAILEILLIYLTVL